MTAVLELESVHKSYHGTPPLEVLRDVSLGIEAGDMVGIVGPSGSGKSTLMNLIGTLDRPTSGVVRLGGRALSGLSDASLAGVRSAYLGFVFQQFHLLETATALENVAAGLLYRGVGPRRRRTSATDALKQVGLGHRLKHRSAQLSGGERQRVAIARAIVGRPAVILADEPTGNLDSRTSEEIIELLLQLNAEGATIVIVTHDIELADRLPRQILVRDGQVQAQ